MENIREQEVTNLLQQIGCKMKKPAFGSGWVIVEPLGGRVTVNCLREAEEYYLSHKKAPAASQPSMSRLKKD